MYQPSILGYPHWWKPLWPWPIWINGGTTQLHDETMNINSAGQGRTMNVLALGNWCAPWVRRCFHSVKSLETSESGLLFGGPVSCCELPDRLFYFDVCRMFYTKCLRFVFNANFRWGFVRWGYCCCRTCLSSRRHCVWYIDLHPLVFVSQILQMHHR
jgi:hypothetical protein